MTGGEPLLQPGVYPLMQAMLDAGLTVLLETSGAIDVREVPDAVHAIVDMKTPSSGEATATTCATSTRWTRATSSSSSSARAKTTSGASSCCASTASTRAPSACSSRRCSASCTPTQLAEWIIADRLPVRFQLQQHKYLWEPNARGV